MYTGSVDQEYQSTQTTGPICDSAYGSKTAWNDKEFLNWQKYQLR